MTPPSQAERARLADENETNPLAGRKLPRRIRRFRADADRYLASLGGPLPYMLRLRQIDDEIEAHAAALRDAYEEHGGDPAAWRAVVERPGTSARSTT